MIANKEDFVRELGTLDGLDDTEGNTGERDDAEARAHQSFVTSFSSSLRQNLERVSLHSSAGNEKGRTRRSAQHYIEANVRLQPRSKHGQSNACQAQRISTAAQHDHTARTGAVNIKKPDSGDFIPNDLVSPARRLRIHKAYEFGADHALHWDEGTVTHVVVEKGIQYKDVLKHLAIVSIPDHIKLVDASSSSSNEPLRCKDASFEQLGPLIEQAKAEKELSFHIDDNSDDDAKFGQLPRSSASEVATPPAAQPQDENSNAPEWQKKFACMHRNGGKDKDSCPNSRTIEILQKMLDYYTETSDQWRILAYRKAIGALKRETKHITTKEQARAIPGVGSRIADKIEEIVCSDRLKRLEYAQMEPRDQILAKFLQIYGVGFAQASRWVAKGYKILDDIKARANLTKNQKIGLERYNDFLQRIPRAEVEQHAKVVKKCLLTVDPTMQVIVGGSYRRGANNSGDIDLIFTKEGASADDIRSVVIDTVVPRFFKTGFLKAELVASSRQDGSKWHGASLLPAHEVWRRIDFLCVPGDEIGAALIYFTGNDIFNRSLRLLARKKDMCLNQHGLYGNVMRERGGVKVSKGSLLESKDEKRIFEILGVPWRPPHHREC
ncbi:hypothetical protein KEM55_002184 [Ascosphaera atra]|nr:hypothetical protein KEM55_002184 [Ascosphaera atra]